VALPPAQESYAVYGIAIQLPRNVLGSYFSVAHPDLRVEIINRMEVAPNLMLVETRISGSSPMDWPSWTDEIERFPGVQRVDLQLESPGHVICRTVLSTGLVEKIVQKHRVLARYPLVIQQGWLRFETVATSSQIRPFLREAQRRVGPSRVESVRRHAVSLGSLGLTPSQDAVFREALRSGYFSVPRRISVSGLAAQLGRSKSSTSEMLSKIHQRLAESALQLDVAPLLART
jgi:predicted DNA binding protein